MTIPAAIIIGLSIIAAAWLIASLSPFQTCTRMMEGQGQGYTEAVVWCVSQQARY